mmetsp:Transcript_5733/g.10285  ORF Transcript_5733/g.10285 Transcript_5733/m.10285 type:complete len:540 (+) Transcript_5733:137-1756(+)|eukprot:CAMPEP_0184708322 /NCGR_PEP_ID=MMETSP0313-20130426/37716_1 /TAXON_ID=2792 /ORGANISM="Porphyridium aerugineum, Strain SAG 1380-2" /LENGTH=539 /DNA_ID=CAMNT_0027169909 /DNA_START=123 /DNA_END=1742 /DNA_ORIENTATION=+
MDRHKSIIDEDTLTAASDRYDQLRSWREELEQDDKHNQQLWIRRNGFELGSLAYRDYAKLCELHNLQMNPTAAICLYTRSKTLKLGRPAKELDLLPIVELLSCSPSLGLSNGEADSTHPCSSGTLENGDLDGSGFLPGSHRRLEDELMHGPHSHETTHPAPTPERHSQQKLEIAQRQVHQYSFAFSNAAVKFVNELDLSGLKLSSASAMLIADLIQKPSCPLTSLILPRNNIRDEGVMQIMLGLKRNEKLKHINLSSNRISPKGALAMAYALYKGYGKLEKLELENNHLEQLGVDIITPICEQRHIGCCTEGNHVLAEILNGVTHGIGLLGGLLAGTSMVTEARRANIGPWLYWSVVTFVVALCTMYFSSCMYHSFFRMGHVKKVLRVMDHCSIFFLIASTYTPFLLRYIWSDTHDNTIVGPLLFYLVWGFALAGIVMSSGVLKKHTPSRAFRATLALCMGWLVVLSIKILWERMPVQCLGLIVAGGVFYTVGVPFYIKGREVSIFHVFWHIAIMFGATAHYAGVLLYVVRAENPLLMV